MPRVGELEARLECSRRTLRRRVHQRLVAPGTLWAAFGGGLAAGWVCQRPGTGAAHGRRSPVWRWLPWGWATRSLWRWVVTRAAQPGHARAGEGDSPGADAQTGGRPH